MSAHQMLTNDPFTEPGNHDASPSGESVGVGYDGADDRNAPESYLTTAAQIAKYLGRYKAESTVDQYYHEIIMLVVAVGRDTTKSFLAVDSGIPRIATAGQLDLLVKGNAMHGTGALPTPKRDFSSQIEKRLKELEEAGKGAAK